jgi:hypothetical protein
LLKEIVSRSDSTVSNGAVLSRQLKHRMLKDAVVAEFEVPTQHLSGGNEEKL